MINWIVKHFNELLPHELYAIMQLRNEVFVVEQNCVYPDADNKDQPSYHLMAWIDERLIAYARLLSAGVAYPHHLSIGRVVISPTARGKGLGKELVAAAVKFARENGMKILPLCPYAKKIIEKSKEFHDVLY